jgi:tetratricopeptide (TPR) repeat protein
LILGDRARARDLLARATSLDPGSADLWYRYARVLEELDAPGEAVDAYCRTLALDDASDDAEDARQRLAVLSQPAREPPSEAAVVAFRTGLGDADAGRLDAAARSFATAASLAPEWPEAQYNHGAVLARLGRREAAAQALRLYLRLEPAPPDVVAVSERIGRLEVQSSGPALSPAAALGLGLAPGLGQVYTGRPDVGFAFLALAGGLTGAAAWAEKGDDRRFVTPGLYLAGGVTAIGALEAWFAARRLGNDGRVADLGPGGAFGLGMLPGMGQLYRGRTGAGLTVLSLATASAATAFFYEEGEGRGFYATGLTLAASITGLAALEATFEANRRRLGPSATPPEPGIALALGVLPGLGQFYQGRLDAGLGFLALAAGLVAASDLAECCDTRRYVPAGLGLAGAVTAVGAVESYLNARRIQRGPATPPPSPAIALGLGLIPGMGQFYSGRPGAGLTVLWLAAGSIATGYLYEEGEGRSLRTEGLVAAGAVTAVGALEAFFRARGRAAGSAQVSHFEPEAAPGRGTPTLRGPTLLGGGPGVRVRLLGMTF